jgi:hypothetical protein
MGAAVQAGEPEPAAGDGGSETTSRSKILQVGMLVTRRCDTHFQRLSGEVGIFFTIQLTDSRKLSLKAAEPPLKR